MSSARAEPADEALAAQVRLADVVALAVARSPSLSELRQKQAASLADSRAATHMPEPQFKYEQWSVPLRKPWALNQAGALMVGLQQVIPPAGTLSARADAQTAQVEVLRHNESMKRLEVAAQAERAFAAYYQGFHQLALHNEHSELVAKLLELARVAYQSGVRSQQDVVRLGLEISRVHETLVHMNPELESSRALLNTLMARPVDAPLGPPAEIDVQALRKDVVIGADPALGRPDVRMAEAQVKGSQAMVAEAHHNANRPMVMVGLDYMYMPQDMYQHTYGGMVAFGLPWLNPGRKEEAKAAQHRLNADKDALRAAALAARFEVRDAQLRLQSARASYDVLNNDVVLQAQRNLDTARSMYAAGQSDASALLDAARLYLEVRIDRVRSLAHLQEAMADLNRALASTTQAHAGETHR
ncbi:MAG: TolC family protein [Deltaproteobacteria bacterium]|nr:TolC family protein [Deltaproteobacteria bacterium]